MVNYWYQKIKGYKMGLGLSDEEYVANYNNIKNKQHDAIYNVKMGESMDKPLNTAIINPYTGDIAARVHSNNVRKKGLIDNKTGQVVGVKYTKPYKLKSNQKTENTQLKIGDPFDPSFSDYRHNKNLKGVPQWIKDTISKNSSEIVN